MTAALFTYAAQLLDVHDGDTIHLDIDLGFHVWRRGERYRLARINAPELRASGGPAAREHLATLLAGGPLTVTTAKADDYGRYLVECIVDDRNVNDAMVADGFAVAYP